MELDLYMNEDLKQEWINALRSGKYNQAEGLLFQDVDTPNGYCCLGVLLDISKKGEWVHHEYDDEFDIQPFATYEMDLHDSHYSMSETLYESVLEEFGIPEEAARLLMSLNDGGPEYPKYSFDSIANVIEQGYYSVIEQGYYNDENDDADD